MLRIFPNAISYLSLFARRLLFFDQMMNILSGISEILHGRMYV